MLSMDSGSRHSGSIGASCSTLNRSPLFVSTASPKNAHGASSSCIAPARRESCCSLEARVVGINHHREWPADTRVVPAFEPARVEEQSQQHRIPRPEPAECGKTEEAHPTDNEAAERQKQTKANEQTTQEKLTVTPAQCQVLIQGSVGGSHDFR